MAPSSRHHERRLQYREDTRKAILEQAERLLSDRGMSGFSMRELASRCGCTAPTVYHYFRGKPALIATLLEARIELLVRELRALPGAEDPVETLRSQATAFALFGVRHPGHYELIVAEDADGSGDSPATGELRDIFTESLGELSVNGDLKESDLERLRQGIWLLVHGFILLQTARPDEAWEPQLLDRSIDALIRGSLRLQDKTSKRPERRAPGDARA